MRSHDPFDIWASDRLGSLKSQWYAGNKAALLLLGGAYVVDLAAPCFLRRVMGVKTAEFAHVLAVLQGTEHVLDDTEFVYRVAALRTGFGWGLGFKWYSKNGVYAASVPYVTNTPYVMDALTKIADDSPAKARACVLFDDTWQFLASLREMHCDGDTLALSYSPNDEPYIVVNANSYSAWAYAMHARHGRPERRTEAEDRALRIIRFVLAQQCDDGRWYYLADRGPHDMIDGFHSCFVVRNLRYAAQLIPGAAPLVDAAVAKGWAYIKREIFDSDAGLSRRYSEISRPDPFKYDLYDQAEYLGLLIDFNEFDAARALQQHVHRRFVRNGIWYCRIDRLGRRWGPGFLRWGIAQFWANEARLKKINGEV